MVYGSFSLNMYYIECLRIVDKERQGSDSTTTFDTTTTGTVTMNYDTPEATSTSAGSNESRATNNSG